MQKSDWLVSKRQVSSTEGIVATMYPHASEAGIEMLRQGGNAVDAAVAAAFALSVVEPFNSGLGGIAVLVYHEAATGKTYVIDGCGTLPAATKPDQFTIDASGRTAGIYSWPEVVGDENQTGWKSIAVPGMPACVLESLERFGSMKRAEVMAPAIKLAEEGFLLDWYVALALAVNQDRMLQFPETARVMYREGKYCYRAPMLSAPADRLVQPDHGRILRDIAEGGADAFYKGRFAELIAEDMAANGGLITYEDMAGYKTRHYDQPLAGSYRGYEILGGPENTGFPTVLSALNILEGYDLKAAGAGTAQELHLLAEAQRRAFQDRFAHLADSDHADVPLTGLMSKEFAAARRASIDLVSADPGAGAGDPWPHEGRAPKALKDASHTGEGNTTHLTVIDKEHNMVSLVSTLGLHSGSCVIPKGTGVLMNDGTMWFDPVPGRVNSLEPGRRIMTAGAPTVILKEGKPFMTLGAPGGRRVISALIHNIVNVIDHGMGPQEALNTPRVHAESRATEVNILAGETVIEDLRQLGHEVVVKEESFSSSYFGRPNGILIDETGTMQAGVNALKPAMAIGL